MTSRIDPTILDYLDGALAAPERAEFERRMAASPALRDAVRRAGAVQALLRGLPRRAAVGVEIDGVLDRVTVEEDSAVAALLRGLPRRAAPMGMFPALLSRWRAEHRRRGASPVVRNLGTMHRLVRVAAAAALVVCGIGLLAGTPGGVAPRPGSAHGFAFDIVRSRPGVQLAAGSRHDWSPAFVDGGSRGAGGGRR